MGEIIVSLDDYFCCPRHNFEATQVPYIAHLLGAQSLVVGDVSDPDL